MEPLDLAQRLALVMLDLKAGDVVILDLAGISDTEPGVPGLVDAFVVGTATGGSHHARALSETVWEEYQKLSKYPGHREGTEASGWILIDCGDIVVHIMSPELRDFYALEDLWGDAPRIPVETDKEARSWSKPGMVE